MEHEHHGPTSRDRFNAKWAVIAALIAALAGAGVQYLASRDVTDAKLLEMSGEMARERLRAERLEGQLRELLSRTRLPAPEEDSASRSSEDPAREADLGPGTSSARNGAVQDEPEGATRSATAAFEPVVVEDPFRFILKECVHARGEQRVQCRLVVENISASKQRLLFNPVYASGGRISFLATDDGRRYGAGGTRNAVETALYRPPEYVPGVPTGVDLVFPGVTEELGHVILVVEADKGLLGRRFTVQFRKVPVREE